MKGFVLNGSKSSICSPVPMKIIGLFVAATLKTKKKTINLKIFLLLKKTYADSAPPPLACPSNFVIITEPIFTFSLKAFD